MTTLAAGPARFRVGRWHGDDRTAHVVPVSGAATLTADSLAELREHLVGQGFAEVFTSAVGPAVRDMLAADRFEEHERLHLLRHDLAQLPVAPPRSAGIRWGRSADRPSVLAIDREAFEPFWQLDHDGLREAITATPIRRLRVARRAGGTVAGYCVTGIGGAQGYLQRLAVASPHRGRGLGTFLVADALRWARRRDADSLWVNTQESNEGALRFYVRNGFEPADHQLTVLHRRL